jgi:hypothetical protein
MASNPVLSTTTKRRLRQRIVFPGLKATDTAITFLEYARSKRTKRFLVGFKIQFSPYDIAYISVQSHLI